MHFAALSAGIEAPRVRFNGVIHSVFDQACNIRLDDGRLLALLTPRLGNVPHGVRIAAPAGFGFATRLAVGQAVGCRADVLRVTRGGLAIDFGTAKPWQAELPPGRVDLTVPEAAYAWQTALRALERDRRSAGGAQTSPLVRAVERQGRLLARAVRQFRADAAAHAVARLIGCGPGLTPSGDDLVVGFLAGLWCTAGDDPARRTSLQALARAVGAAASATGDISRTYLSHASRGWFAEPLGFLAARIGEGADRGQIERASAAALRVGHTSGGAGVHGLLLGLAAWAAHPVPSRNLGMPADG
jgi:hypothetical protein